MKKLAELDDPNRNRKAFVDYYVMCTGGWGTDDISDEYAEELAEYFIKFGGKENDERTSDL